MPFRNLASWTGTGGLQSLEPDQDSGLWRSYSPPRTQLNASTYSITSEDVMRGVLMNAIACTYTMPSAASLLADYPDWPIGGAITFAIFGLTAAVAKAINPGTSTTLLLGSGTAATGACYITLWRESETLFRYNILRNIY